MFCEVVNGGRGCEEVGSVPVRYGQGAMNQTCIWSFRQQFVVVKGMQDDLCGRRRGWCANRV